MYLEPHRRAMCHENVRIRWDFRADSPHLFTSPILLKRFLDMTWSVTWLVRAAIDLDAVNDYRVVLEVRAVGEERLGLNRREM
jgi:hypothetical protein